MKKWMNFTDDLAQTYRFDAFLDLKQLFDRVDDLYNVSSNRYADILSLLPQSIQEYLNAVSMEEKLAEINRNSATPESFRKRFFQVFDAFHVLKFLNMAHERHYQRQNLPEAIMQLHKKIRNIE